MVYVHKTSLQQKPTKSSKFQQIKHFMKVKLKPYHTHAVYMHAYVDTGADVNLMSRDVYIKLFNDDKLKHLKPSDIKLGVWGWWSDCTTQQVQHLPGTPRHKETSWSDILCHR